MSKIYIISIITVFAVMVLANANIINIPADYPTIQAGIDVSTDGDTVLVQPGTYVENINFNGHNIVLGSLFLTTGDTSYIEQTVIDGNSSGAVVIFENEENYAAMISGFTLQNGSSDFGGGISCQGFASPIIENNMIIGNWADWGGGGVYFESTISQFRRNVVYANFAYGFGGGILCIYNSNPTLINNTITTNFAFWGGGMSCIDTSYPIIKNTIFWNDTAYSGGQEIFGDDASWPEISYCDVQGGWVGQGNIDSDPMFADAFNGDFHLLPGSPCIDTGDPNLPLDPDSTRADMGALYFDQSVKIDDLIKELPKRIMLFQNYPNPFNASTVIQYELTRQSQVKIEIYDILGRKISTLINAELPAGYHQAIWHADNFASGMYFYKLQAGNHSEVKKMLLLK